MQKLQFRLYNRFSHSLSRCTSKEFLGRAQGSYYLVAALRGVYVLIRVYYTYVMMTHPKILFESYSFLRSARGRVSYTFIFFPRTRNDSAYWTFPSLSFIHG